MTSRPVRYEQGRTDVVTAVVVPMDGATRLPVRHGVDVQLWDPAGQRARASRLVRNLSGQAVLLNEVPDQELTFRIGTERSFYRGPLLVAFNPAQDGLRRVVALERRPDASFDDVATIVRGVVTRSPDAGDGAAGPVEGVTVSVDVASPGHQFPATTDGRGSFALVVDLRPPAPDEPTTVPAQVRLAKDGQLLRTLPVALEHGRAHVFSAPIDLVGTRPIRFSHEPDT